MDPGISRHNFATHPLAPRLMVNALEVRQKVNLMYRPTPKAVSGVGIFGAVMHPLKLFS